MAYISPTGQIARGPITSGSGSSSPNPKTPQPAPQTSGGGGDSFAQWHTALLWFLGAVALIALAGPAPNVSTMIVVILIVSVLLGHWSNYAMFLGLANATTGGTSQGG